MNFSMTTITAFLIAASANSANAEDYATERKQSADRAMTALDRSHRQISGSEYLLMSLFREVSLAELRPLVGKTGVKLTGVYLCADGGGVMAVHLDPQKEPWTQLGDPRDPDGVSATLSKAQSQMARLGGQLNFPSHDRYCGVEVQGTYEQTFAIRTALKDRIHMAEITTSRIRMAAANVVKR